MIRWYNYLYLDKLANKKLKQVKKRMESGKVMKGVYCITLPQNGDNLFEIIQTNQLIYPYYKSKEIYVLGLAYGKDSAIDLLTEMVMDILDNTDDFDGKNYYKLDDFK